MAQAPSPTVPATTTSPPAVAPAPSVVAPRLPFSAFVGLRYLKPRRTFVSIITLISIAGVILGVALPIIVLAVMTGFDQELHSKVLGFDPHIEITRNGGLLDDWREVRKIAAGVPGVVATAPYVRGPVLVEANSQRVAAFIRGVDPALEHGDTGTTDYGALMKSGDGRHAEGRFDLDGDNAVVGYDLAHTLGIHVGDKLTIISSHSLEKLTKSLDELRDKKADEQKIAELREMVAPAELTVTGIFDSGRWQYDSAFVFVPFYVGQELYELSGSAHGVAVRVAHPYDAETVKQRLLEKLDPSLNAQTWIDLNAQFFDAVRTERTMQFIIMFFILVVAAFCVMNTLITVTVQKTREIGIMKAVGADVWQIVRVFLSQGVVVGLFGTLGGLGAARCILALLNPFKAWLEWQFHIVVFAKQVYGFGRIPYAISPWDATAICVSAFVICSLAALIPAYFAARLDPVKALRFD